jgi:hypothetical protein
MLAGRIRVFWQTRNIKESTNCLWGQEVFILKTIIVFRIRDDFILKTKMGCQGCFLFGKRRE